MKKLPNFKFGEQFAAVYIYDNKVWSGTYKMTRRGIDMFNTETQSWDDNVTPAWEGLYAHHVTQLRFFRTEPSVVIKSEAVADE